MFGDFAFGEGYFGDVFTVSAPAGTFSPHDKQFIGEIQQLGLTSNLDSSMGIT